MNLSRSEKVALLVMAWLAFCVWVSATMIMALKGAGL